MRRLMISTMVVGVALLGASSAASAAAGHRKAAAKCPMGRSHVVVADAQAQVYVGPLLAEGSVLPEVPVFYGCTYRQKKSYELGKPGGGGSPYGSGGSRLYTLAAAIVAYEEYSTTNLQPGVRHTEVIVVRNLHGGRVLNRLPTGTPTTPPENPGDVGVGGATAIVLKSDGAVAWIVAVSGKTTEYQVHAFDKAGSRVLASSTEIAPSSLALAGSTLYWTQSGKPMSAALN
jgi:hypothetical protein